MYSTIRSKISDNFLARTVSISGYSGILFLFLVLLTIAPILTACNENKSQNEAALAVLAYSLQEQDEKADCTIDQEDFTAGGSGSIDCSDDAVATGEVYLSRENDAHPLLSMEVTYQLEDGGSLQMLGGIKSVADDGSFDYGHGIKIENNDAHFMGVNATGELQELEAHSEEVGEFESGTDEQTVCFEIHMNIKEPSPHILINWTNNSCDGLSSEGQADANSEGEDHDHEEHFVRTLRLPVNSARELGNDESTEGLQNYKTYGLILNNATVKSITRYSSEHFPHG